MDRTVIKPAGYQDRGIPLSPAIRSGNLVFVSGQVAADRASSAASNSDTQAETRTVLENLQAVLVAAGTSLERVVKTTVYLTDLGEFSAFNEVYREYFAAEPPARSTVEVSRLVGSCTVEIDAIAMVDAPTL